MLHYFVHISSDDPGHIPKHLSAPCTTRTLCYLASTAQEPFFLLSDAVLRPSTHTVA